MELAELLRFAFLPGVGARTLLRLVRGFPPALALAGRARLAWAHGSLWARAGARAAAELQRARQAGVRILALTDPDYPPHLAAWPDPPPLLWVRGCLPRRPGLAVVGTRAPTGAGAAAAAALAAAAAGRGWPVVSGLARGVDAAAHRGALAAGGVTLAVLGGGLDRLYPPEHAALAAALLRRGGGLVSEQPLGTPATPAGLVRRDRIQAGLAAAVAVVETAPDGGALHAARAALAGGRPVLVPARSAPGPPAAGQALLLRWGARPYAAADAALDGLAAPPGSLPAPPQPPTS